MRLKEYTYAYKTSDGVRHEEIIEAPSREYVFAELRKRGIKAIKVIAADGSKANGETEEASRKRKEVWRYAVAAVLIALVTLASLVTIKSFVGEKEPPGAATETPRHQIYGDPALMEELYESGFSGVFDDMIDRYMAYYAQPGIMPDERLLAKLRPEVLTGGNKKKQAHPRGIVNHAIVSSREIRELRDIVFGMRIEMQSFLADGSSMAEYINSLAERQQEEKDIYERVAAELDGEQDESVREKKNAALRMLGLKTVPRPKKHQR